MRETIDPGFTILVDSAEQQPFTFKGLRSDANQGNRLFYPRWMRFNLGRHPDSMGDYSIYGAFGKCHIERKSKEDAWGTILGWTTGWEQDRELPGRRERFEQELSNLNKVDHACVVVESSLADCVSSCPQWGVKTGFENGKIFFRSVISYQQRFPKVQWAFMDDREWAQTYTFRFFQRYYRKHKEEINNAIAQTNPEF